MIPPVKLIKHRRAKPNLPEPQKPKFSENQNGEILVGSVQGMEASAAEERAVRAISKNKKVDGYEFRRAVLAPRNTPGFKELDLLVASKGMNYAFEIDSPFTHRNKERADVLHDAQVLRALEQQGFLVWPRVFHIQGEDDLVDQQKADTYFNGFFQ